MAARKKSLGNVAFMCVTSTADLAEDKPSSQEMRVGYSRLTRTSLGHVLRNTTIHAHIHVYGQFGQEQPQTLDE